MYVHTVEAPRACPHPRLRGATFSFVERGVESVGPLNGSDGFYVGVGQRGELRVVDGFTDRDLATIREDSEGSQDRMSRVDMVCPGGVGPPRGPLPEELEHPAVTRRTLSCEETRVQQGCLLAPKDSFHRVVGFLCLTDGIANNDSTSTIGELSLK